MSNKTIDLPMRHRSAEIMPQSINDKENTVTVVWSTGAAVRRYSYETGEICEEVLSLEEGHVDLSRLNNGAAFLNLHNSYDLDSILGVVTRAWIENGQGLADVRMDTSETAVEVFRKIKAGILRSVSIGYNVSQFERIQRDGEVPIYRAINWYPFEISAVCVPADAGAGFRNKPNSNHCIITETREKPMTNANPAADAAADTPVTPEAVKPTAAATPDKLAAADDSNETTAIEVAVKEERQRCADITTAAGKLGVPDSFARNLIDKGVSLTRAQTALIDYAAEHSPTASIRSQQPQSNGKSAVDESLPLETRAKAEWEKDATLRTEFRSYDTYLHYKRAMDSGKVRIKSN